MKIGQGTFEDIFKEINLTVIENFITIDSYWKIPTNWKELKAYSIFIKVSYRWMENNSLKEIKDPVFNIKAAFYIFNYFLDQIIEVFS